jgi:hypothetical protein
MEKTELCLLAEKWKTDKCKALFHNYTPYYYDLLKDKKETATSVLELGIGFPGCMSHVSHLGYKKGASLYMWRDFFPNSKIYGIDIKAETMFEDDRIQTYLSGQTDYLTLEKVLGDKQFDLIVDDASHQPQDQKKSFLFLQKYLKPDGIYIIEDLINGLWPNDQVEELFEIAKKEHGFKIAKEFDIRKDSNYKVGDDRFLFFQK